MPRVVPVEVVKVPLEMFDQGNMIRIDDAR